MVIDVHSHYWEYPTDFTADFREQARRAKGGVEFDLAVRYEDYMAACRVPVRTVVFGGKAKLSGVWVDDRRIAADRLMVAAPRLAAGKNPGAFFPGPRYGRRAAG